MSIKAKNVVLLTIDALRKDVLGLYGCENGLSPFLDSLRDKCILFTKAHASGPYTQASFPGLLCSSYYLDYGKPNGLPKEKTIVSEPLKRAGITTAAFHSNPYLSATFGWNRGWDVFYDSLQESVNPRIPYVKGDVINKKVSNWVSLHSMNPDYDPFFLWLHYMDVHEPYMPKIETLSKVDSSMSVNQDEMYDLFINILRKRDVRDFEKVKLLKQLYFAEIIEVDSLVRNFFEVLERSNILNDTIVIITSDHGDEFGEHGGLGHDDKMYSELVEVPLIFYDPDLQNCAYMDELVSGIDIPPTICDIFKIDPPAEFIGKSLLSGDISSRNGVFGEAIDQRGVKGGNIELDVYFYREQDIKIIYRPHLGAYEIYDLAQDPGETTNIFDISPKTNSMKETIETFSRRWLR